VNDPIHWIYACEVGRLNTWISTYLYQYTALLGRVSVFSLWVYSQVS